MGSGVPTRVGRGVPNNGRESPEGESFNIGEYPLMWMGKYPSGEKFLEIGEPVGLGWGKSRI